MSSPKRKSASKTKKRISTPKTKKRISAPKTKKRISPKRKSVKRISTPKTQTKQKFTDKQKKCRGQKIGITMYEFKKHMLRSRDNKVVRNPKQAIAIALSQANRLC